jgi:hypothetical protein
MAEKKIINTELQPIDKLLDSSGDAGTSGQILSSTGGGTNWINAGGGTITGSGTDNYIPLWNGTTALDDSIMFQTGTDQVKLSSAGNAYFTIRTATTTAETVLEFADSSGASGGLIYNHTSNGLAFKVNASERMRIDNSGKVGIGTASPAYKLDVNGGSIFMDSDWPLYLGSTSAFIEGNSTGTILRSNASAGFTWTDGGTTQMKLDTDGKLGIGTSSPSAKLHISGSDSTSSAIRQSRVGTVIWDQAIDSSGRLQWGTRSSEGGTRTVHFTVDDSGDVGIGTGAPAYKLDVAGVIKATSSIRVDAGSPYFGLYNSGTEKAYLQWSQTSSVLTLQSDGAINYTSGGLQKWTISGTQLLTLTTGGDLQIGTTTVITSGRRFYSSDGSAASPAYSFSGFTDDGMYRQVYDTTKSTISFATEGTRRGRMGEFGIWSDANVYATNQFRSFANPWYATAGTSGAGFKFTNSADSNDLLDIDGSGNATFLGKASSAQTASSDGNSVLTTKSYVDGLVTGVTRYMGLWDASSGTGGSPDLTASTYKVPGYYFIVSVAGDAEPNGAGTEPDTWHVGDWVIWSDQATDAWQKIDNTSVLSGTGTANKVAMWNGDESLTNAPITISSNDSTFAGKVYFTTATDYIDVISDDLYIVAADKNILYSGGSETLRLDESQNATFKGEIKLQLSSTVQRALSSTGTESMQIGDAGINLLRFKNTSGVALDIETTGTATFSNHIDLSDNKYLMWGGNAIMYHTGAITYIGDNSSSSVIGISNGVSTFYGNIKLDDNSGASPNVQFVNGANASWYIYNDSNGKFQVQQSSDIRATFSSGDLEVRTPLKVSAGAVSISSDGANYATLTESDSGDLTISAVDDIRLDSGGQDIVLRGASSQEFGRLTNNSGNFNITGSDIKIDASGDITLDADGNDIRFMDNTVEYGKFKRDGGDFNIYSSENDKDMKFIGQDNNSDVTALRLDMSDSGWAHFNTGIAVGNLSATSTFSGALQWGNGTGVLTYGSDRAILRSASSKALELQTNGGTTLMTGVDANATFAGNVYLAGTKKLYLADDGTNNYIAESSDNVLDFVSAGVVGLQLSGTSANMRSVNFNGNITTETDSTFNIGSTSKRFANIWVDNINGGTPTTGGPYLPLSGGTITGGVTIVDDVGILFGTGGDSFIKHTGTQMSIFNDVGHMYIVNRADDKNIIFQTDDGTGGVETYFYLDGLGGGTQPFTVFPDAAVIAMGSNHDTYIQHTGAVGKIDNYTGNYEITNHTDDGDLSLRCDNGSGGTQTYLKLNGSIASMIGYTDLLFGDSLYLKFGASQDFTIGHNAVDTYLTNATGDLEIINNQDDGDIIFKSDDGSGGNATYFYLDGGNTRVQFNKDARFVDDKKVMLGTSDDLQIYHSSMGTGSFIIESGPGDLEIYSDTEVHLKSGAMGENYAKFTKDGPIELYYDNSKKFETKSTGISVTGDIVVSGDVEGRSIPCLFNSNFSDGTSSSIQVVPFNSLSETTVSTRTYYHNITMPYAGKLTKVVMKNVSGSPSSSFTTQLFFYVNGSQQASSAELTISSDKIEWSPTASNTFSAGDELSFGYQKSLSNKTWSGVSYGVAIELTNYDI